MILSYNYRCLVAFEKQSGYRIVAKKSVLYILFLTAFGYNIVMAQPADSTKQRIIRMQTEMLSHYNDSVFNSKKNYVTGKLYYSGGNKFVHPFYGDNSWVPAMVFTPGKVYNMDLAKYDLYLDYLVILHNFESLSYPVYLNKEFVREFAIYGHHFKYLDEFDGSLTPELTPGYYEVYYKGETKFYVRRIKLKKFDKDDMAEVYSDRIYFFLKKGGQYFRVTGQKSLINALNDHKKEIKTFMKQNTLRFSPGNYEVIDKILTFYDML